MTARGFGHGKVILLGEHAVVHGQPALAGALALGVELEARPCAEAGPTVRLRLPAWQVDTVADPTGSPARALAALAAALELRGRWELVGQSELPPRAGLGSSAALAVAAARALLVAEGRSDDVTIVERAAMAAESIFHGNPSGIDVALAARGGLGLFRRGQGLNALDAAPLRLAVASSGLPRDTAALVAGVARRRQEAPDAADAALAELGVLALAGRDALVAGEPVRLGPLFDRAHALLAELGVSSPALERLREVARTAGAAGAKLTGAGGGGAVIAVGREDEVVAAWRAAGVAAWVVDVGVYRV